MFDANAHWNGARSRELRRKRGNQKCISMEMPSIETGFWCFSHVPLNCENYDIEIAMSICVDAIQMFLSDGTTLNEPKFMCITVFWIGK